MFLGYNTNGLAHHDLFDAVELLAEIGYRGVAVTIDHGSLAPAARDLDGQIVALGRLLARHRMRSAIETGGRFLLDPRRKHEPTLVSADPAGRARRVAFYRHAIDCAARLESDCVSLFSGVLHDEVPRDVAMARLAEGLGEVLDHAAARGVPVAFEPEPGMVIDSMARFEELLALVGRDDLRLTLDVGHLQCQGELPIGDVIRRWAPRLVNVHIEDMRRGTHDHLMFGEGQIDFPPILRALAEVGYNRGIHVELSRHSHEAPTAARRAMEFLRPMVEKS